MATANVLDASRESVVDKQECCLCKGDFKTPRLLPCQHSFCTPCLKRHISETEAHNFLCPTCDFEVTLQSSTVESLPQNYLYNIKTKKTNELPLAKKCIPCEIQGKSQTAELQCLDCEDAFCNQCQAFHKLSSASKHHRLVSVKEIKSGKYKDQLKEKDLYCNEHSGGSRQRPLRMYCKKCEVLHCEECMSDENIHSIIPIDKWEGLYKEKLESFVKEVDILVNNVKTQKNIVGVIHKEEERIHEKRAAIENQIYDKATEIQELVERVKNETLTKVKEHFDNELQKCKTLLKEEENSLKRLEATTSFVEDFSKHSTEGEYLMHQKDVKARMADSMVKRERFEMRIQDLILQGQPTGDLEKTICDVIGHLKPRTKCIDATGKKRLMKMDPIVEGKIKLKVKAHGIAVADNGDIIVVGGSKIEILNKDGESKRVIECKELKHAWSVTLKNDLIYVTDSESPNKKLLVLDLNGHLRTIIRMPESEQCFIRECGVGVAVGNGGTVFVSVWNTSKIYTCSLDSTKLELFNSKIQQPKLSGPYNLSMTSSGYLAVSSRESNIIQVYDNQAKLQGQFSNADTAFGLCSDTEDHIFIGSYGSNKISVVKDGVLIRRIDIPNVACIRGLALTRDGDLLVSHNTNEITNVSLWG